jgi:N-acetylglucosaminyldiphosphoundecaprenol N-acetyl-beta-D-mannosaminyltransferase
MTEINKVNICDVLIDNVTFEETLSVIDKLIRARNYSYIVTPNVDHIVKLQDDLKFKEIYQNASLVLADGMPLLWAAKILKTPFKEKISGSDLFPKLCEVSTSNNYKLFFLGGRPGAADKAAKIMRTNYPGINIVGTYAPPYGFENDNIENDKVNTMIKEAKPDILFVGLGAPKQEKWIYKNRDQLQVPVSIGIGATFEFVSGMVKRAPLWMQQCGFEWFWRLMSEPRRLWRRYLIEDLKFIPLLFKQLVS